MRRSSLLLALLFGLLSGCTYTVEDWWTDVVEGYCFCNYPATEDECFDAQWEAYQETDYWDACHDDEAPVDKSEVRAWYTDYTENCDLPDMEEPRAEDPYWFESCEG